MGSRALNEWLRRWPCPWQEGVVKAPNPGTAPRTPILKLPGREHGAVVINAGRVMSFLSSRGV